MKQRKRKLKPYKVNRGSFEEQKLREDKKTETQRALLFILPIVMLAVLAVGIFFGYKSYEKSIEDEKKILAESAATEPAAADPMLLTAVTPSNPLDKSYVPALLEYNGVQISPDMAESLEEMLTAAEQAGYPLIVKEGYISFKEQKERYDTAVEKYRKESKLSLVKAESKVKQTIPREGESEQQTGLIVMLDDEVKGKFSESEGYRWLLDNAIDYGFILRYPDPENVGGIVFTPKLFRYVGVENAYRMRAYNMNFDEYAAYMAYH